ncbi:MAG TPA: T9SS type A sorting domain-containing protein [Parafilimonas sp.]|nr:T9SS type A sorting domain-containing protein [Parafilimonas sp.]
MKTFFTIAALFFVNSLFSQYIFSESVGINDEDKVSSVIEAKDGFIGTGYTETYSNGYDKISLYKIGFNGQFIWGKEINVGNNTYNYENGSVIIKTHDNGFAITGTVGADANEQICILKFDENGLLKWTKQYAESSGTNGNKLVQTDDNGFLIAGGYSTNANGSLAYLIKTDSAGNLKWSKKFSNTKRFDDLKRTIDSNYILLAEKTIIKIDTAGNILWSKTLISPANEFSFASSTILPVKDGGYLITGSFEQSTGNYTEYGVIVRLDKLGNLVWSKFVDADDLELGIAIETTKKDLILSGRRVDEDNNYHHYFIKLNSSGTLIWTKDISGAGQIDYVNDLIATSDNGYLAATTSTYISRNFLKFDSEFNICEPIQSLGSLLNSNFSIKNATISTVTGNTVTYTRSVTISSGGSVTNICSALPVTLAAFNAALQKKSVQIYWTTTTETNTSYFNIQRSTNGIDFSNIAKVIATGNSNSAHNYAYSDLNVAEIISANTVYYRLQTIDKDGSIALSKIVPVKLKTGTITLFLLPNPVRDKLSARIINYNGIANVRIYDVAGKLLYNKIAATNYADIIINTAALKAGMYLLQINANGLILRRNFVKE